MCVWSQLCFLWKFCALQRSSMKQSVSSRYQTGIHKPRSCSWFQQGPLTNHSISSPFSFPSCIWSFGFIPTIISSGQKSSRTGFCTALTHHCQFTLILVSLHLLSPHPDTVVTSTDVSKPSKTGAQLVLQWLCPCRGNSGEHPVLLWAPGVLLGLTQPLVYSPG